METKLGAGHMVDARKFPRHQQATSGAVAVPRLAATTAREVGSAVFKVIAGTGRPKRQRELGGSCWRVARLSTGGGVDDLETARRGRRVLGRRRRLRHAR